MTPWRKSTYTVSTWQQMVGRCRRKHLTKNGVRLVPSGKAPRPPHFWYILKVTP